ncbi:NifB/NifX family molybdenum-iron cluster-binding protein [Pontiella sp.]|uniref:NifB/NifX family molybdenum-iron cluster-binding protein n=1 Tax=Pontiella sp. TaxID=2837462 RepID=UPI0035624FD3
MKIAIPTAQGKLCMHFGHCEVFTMLDIDPEKKTVTAGTELVPPPHEPGVLPAWLAEQGATTIIAGGMGSRAQALFAQHNIETVVGAPSETPEMVAQQWLAGNLTTGSNACDH